MSTCPVHHISIGEAGCPLCSRKKKTPGFGKGPRTPLKQSRERTAHMSAEAEVQPEVGGRCILLGFMPGDCGVKPHRCHIVSQETIRDTYKLGAWRYVGEEFWRPVTRDTVLGALTEGYEFVTLQQILDDSANLVQGCENHNKDGLEMIDALDARKVAGLPSYPTGFGEFTHAFRFSIEGQTYWYYVPFEGVEAA